MSDESAFVDEPLAATAARYPRAVALRHGDRSVTWAELDEVTAVRAATLAELAPPGARVALLEPFGPDLVTTVHACVRAGLSVVPLACRSPASELVRQLADCRPALLLASSNAPHAPDVAAQAAVEAYSFDRSIRPLPDAPGRRRNGGRVDPSSELCVLYTSGSSGRPKGVRLTVANHLASARGCAESLGGLWPDDTWIASLGAHRVGGLAVLVRSAVHGFAVDVVPRFDAADVVAACARGATLASFVPAMLHRLLGDVADARSALGRLRVLMVGGAPASRSWVEAWVAAGLRVCPTYGMTETCSQIATTPPGRALEHAGSVGPAHSEATVRIDPLGDGDGRVGEILVAGAVLSPGYVTPPARPGFVEEDGALRFRTGDVGSLDDNGNLSVLGRLDRTVNTGGEKVQPEEVECVLAAHPAVRDVAVRGVPDPVYGELVEAVIAGDAAADDLKQWCADRLAPHKVPRRFAFVEAVPRSEDGKLVRMPADD